MKYGRWAAELLPKFPNLGISADKSGHCTTMAVRWSEVRSGVNRDQIGLSALCPFPPVSDGSADVAVRPFRARSGLGGWLQTLVDFLAQ
jgi:hypothetical protein